MISIRYLLFFSLQKASLTVTQASLEVITTNKMDESETNRLSQEEIEELQSLRLKVTSMQTENTRLKEQVRVSFLGAYRFYF